MGKARGSSSWQICIHSKPNVAKKFWHKCYVVCLHQKQWKPVKLICLWTWAVSQVELFLYIEASLSVNNYLHVVIITRGRNSVVNHSLLTEAAQSGLTQLYCHYNACKIHALSFKCSLSWASYVHWTWFPRAELTAIFKFTCTSTE